MSIITPCDWTLVGAEFFPLPAGVTAATGNPGRVEDAESLVGDSPSPAGMEERLADWRPP